MVKHTELKIKGWRLNYTQFIGAINSCRFVIGKLLDRKTYHDEEFVNVNTYYKRNYMQDIWNSCRTMIK